MPVITAHTETTLATLMDDTIGPTLRAVLLWTAPTTTGTPAPGVSYQRIVNQALREYGLTSGQTIANATDMDKLETAARFAVWSAAWAHGSPLYDETIGGQSRSRSQMVVHAEKQWLAAQTAWLRYSANNRIGRSTLRYTNDPYRGLTDEEVAELAQ